MNWLTKAAIQNVIALFPSGLSYELYYQVQRSFGGLKRVDPIKRLRAGIDVWRMLIDEGFDPADSRFLEVGTGRVPLVPISYWLLGAKHTTTVDLNPYIKQELLNECLDDLRNRRDEITEIYGDLLIEDRFQTLLDLAKEGGKTTQEILDVCSIEYLAPADAQSLNLPDCSIDFHTSYTVLEHIPPKVISGIFREASRVLTKTGACIHRVDYSDHFSHSDPTISPINFLKFSDRKWNWIAGNRYMYMNRLRHDDMLEVLGDSGHVIVATDPTIDTELQAKGARGELELWSPFQNKSPLTLATTGSWIVTHPSA